MVLKYLESEAAHAKLETVTKRHTYCDREIILGNTLNDSYRDV